MEKIDIEQPITKLSFGLYNDTVKIHDMLKRYGVKNIELLCRLNDDLVVGLTAMTKPMLTIVKAGLASYGLRLNMTTDELIAYKNLPEDYFKSDSLELSEVEELRAEVAQLRLEKSSLQNEINELVFKRDKFREEYWDSFINHIDVYKELQEERDKAKELVERLETLTLGLRKPPFRDSILDSSKSESKDGKFGITRDESYQPVLITDPQETFFESTKEEQDDSDPFSEHSHYIDLLSKNELCDLVKKGMSSIHAFMFKEFLDGQFYHNNAKKNLFHICQMSRDEVTKLFGGHSEIMIELEVALIEHDLRFGMSVEKLNRYQTAYEKWHRMDDGEKEDACYKEGLQAFEEFVDYLPCEAMHISDLAFVRARMVEKAYCSQPWYVKLFCSTKSRCDKAVVEAAKLYDSFIVGLRNITVAKLERESQKRKQEYGRKQGFTDSL